VADAASAIRAQNVPLFLYTPKTKSYLLLTKKMVDLFNYSVEERDDQLVEERNLLAGHSLTKACSSGIQH
jgi:hypothetical protein